MERHVTLIAKPGESPEGLCERFAAEVGEAAVLGLTAFGAAAVQGETLGALGRACGEVAWPVTWIDGAGFHGSPLAGLQAAVVSGATVQRLSLGGRIVGSACSNGGARWCLVGGVHGDPAASRREQARATFEALDAVLAQAGLGFSDVVRTWLYADRILEWYSELNQVRSAFFAEPGRIRLVPASTGVGAGNGSGAALMASALACRPSSAVAVPSPLQCSALDYGSAFSRAVELGPPGSRRLLVSGTASIDPAGATVHGGDAREQLALTLRVVEALLASRGAGWGDVTRRVAYVPPGVDAAQLVAGGLEGWLVVRADLCRADLLVEIELDVAFQG